MSVIVIKSETTGYRILVKAGDEELARQEAVKAAISAEAARLSAIDAGESEQVATQKAAQTVEDAAEALASKQEAESAATDSGGFATNSGISASASNAAKLLSETAKVIAIEEAGKSSTSAGQSVASAAAAEAAKNQILNKAEVNLTTAGNILRADGTVFKSISEVEFLRNKAAFAKSYLSTQVNLHGLIQFDSFYGKSNGAIPVSNGGSNWVNYAGSTFRVRDQGLQLSTVGGANPLSPSFNGLELSPKNEIFNKGNYLAKVSFSSATGLSFIFFNSTTNYLEINFNNVKFRVFKIVNGVSTQILLGFPIPAQYRNSLLNAILSININLNCNFINGESSKASLKIDFDAYPIANVLMEDNAITLAINEIFASDANNLRAFCVGITPNVSPVTRFNLVNSLAIYDTFNLQTNL
jgi:hypothetical protein